MFTAPATTSEALTKHDSGAANRMSYYPDDVTPSMFDKYWSDKLGPDDADDDPTPDDYEGQENV